MSITRIHCEKCGFPMVACSCVTAIEKAAEAALKLAWEMVGYTGDVDWASTQSMAEEIKRELEKAVPAKDAGVLTGYELGEVSGWNDALLEIGLDP